MKFQILKFKYLIPVYISTLGGNLLMGDKRVIFDQKWPRYNSACCLGAGWGGVRLLGGTYYDEYG